MVTAHSAPGAALRGVAIETDPASGLVLRCSPVRIGGMLSQALPFG